VGDAGERRDPAQRQPSCWAAASPAVNATVVTASTAARSSVTSRSRTAAPSSTSSPQNCSTHPGGNGCDSNPGFLLRSYSNATLERLQRLWEWRMRTLRAREHAELEEPEGFGWWFGSDRFDEDWALTHLGRAVG